MPDESAAPTARPFDLSQYEIDDTGTLDVLDVTGNAELLGTDGNPVTIELYSPGSKQGVSALHRAGQKSQLRLQGLMRGKASRDAAKEADAEQVEKLVAFTKQISPNFPVPPHDLYANPKLGYIRRQVEKYIDDDANFSKRSTPS